MRPLLDPSVLIGVLRLQHGRRELLAELARVGHTLATTALNVAELYAGMPPEEESRTENFIDAFDCYDLEVSRTNTQEGDALLIPADTIVAAIAIERRCTLMTDNPKDFPMPELNCYNLPQS